MILLTGGAGFIGANFVDYWCRHHAAPLINLDALTYAGSLANLRPWLNTRQHQFVHGNILDRALVTELLQRHQPQAVLHLAAESHVDRSIHTADAFMQTNVLGTLHLLQAVLQYWQTLPPDKQGRFRYVQVSTDEVYGSLERDAPPFTRSSPYAPSSPYAASKAAADHWVRAWHTTYGLPTLIAHSSNNFGPYQYPEKLIPLALSRMLQGEPVPVYGNGQQERDWLYVADHCRALATLIERGQPGRSYLIGSGTTTRNLDLLRRLSHTLERQLNSPETRRLWPGVSTPLTEPLWCHVADRPGHDTRYALDCSAIRQELGWQPSTSLDAGLRQTVAWYLDNRAWLQERQSAWHSPFDPDTTHHAVP